MCAPERKGQAVEGMYTSFSCGYCGKGGRTPMTVWGLSFMRNHFADYRGIAAKTAQPVFVAEQQDRGRARFFVVGGKIAADEGLGAKDIE